MTATEPPTDPVQAALLELGSTSQQVADSLAARGIKGRVCSATGCPVAQYVRSRFTGPFFVDNRQVFGPTGWHRLPRPVAQFIEEFDQGMYEALRTHL